MFNGELGQKGVDRVYLNSFPATGCLYGGRCDVILKVGNNQRQSGKLLDEAFSLFWPVEPLE